MPKLSPKEFRDRVIGRPAKSTFVSSCYVHFCPDEEECFYLNGDPRLPFGRVPFSLVEAMESLDDETVRIHFRPNDIVAAQLALAVGVSLSEPTVDATLSPPSTLLSEEKAENELTTTLQFIGEYRDGTSTNDYHQFLIEDTDWDFDPILKLGRYQARERGSTITGRYVGVDAFFIGEDATYVVGNVTSGGHFYYGWGIRPHTQTNHKWMTVYELHGRRDEHSMNAEDWYEPETGYAPDFRTRMHYDGGAFRLEFDVLR